MNSTKNRFSYLFIAILALICVVLVSVRYGINIEKINMTNEYILALQAKLSLTPSPRPYLIPSLSRVTSRDCGISYLIPNVATGSAQITCIDPQSTISAELIKSGYKKAEAVPIYLHVYIKADEDITRLFLESVVTE